MFSDPLVQLVWSLGNIYHAAHYASYSLLLTLVCAIPYTIWRLWTFTIAPALHTQEPKQIPYLIPILGHAISFFKDYNGMLAYGRQYFGNSGETYKITFPGHDLYLMTSPEEISRIYKNTTELTFDTFIRGTLIALGASPSAVDKWIPPRLHIGNTDTTQNDYSSPMSDFTHVGERLCQRQLLPGKDLDDLQKVFMAGIHDALTWDKITPKIILRSSPDTKTVSLLGWSREVLLEAATVAFFGDRLLQINPDLFQSFFSFDASSYKLNYGYPRVLSRDLFAARDAINEALTTYFKLPKADRPGAAWLIQSFETELRCLNIEDKDIAALVMPVYWVINANAYKHAFWMMAYILHSPNLLDTLRDEITPTMCAGTTGLEYRLEQQCPRLRAVYLEVLRLTSSSSTVRGVQRTTEIGNKVLRGGSNILIPYRQLHMNPDIFGTNAERFDPERFLRDKTLCKNPSFRPFGGGRTYCPGRYLAEREILTFVALALYRFDINLAAGEHATIREGITREFPRIDKKKFCLGIMEPVKGDDIILSIRRRI